MVVNYIQKNSWGERRMPRIGFVGDAETTESFTENI